MISERLKAVGEIIPAAFLINNSPGYMKNKINFLAILLILMSIVSCSSSQNSGNDEEKIYVFDEQKEGEQIEVKQDGQYPNLDETYYVVQIGAFTTKQRAESFAELSRKKISYDVIITLNENNNLYLVQISPFYKSRQEAELVRNEIKDLPEFSDAWIVTVNK